MRPGQEECSKKWMMLDDITKDQGIQVRVKSDPNRIQDYAEIIVTCGYMDPMTVFKIEGECGLQYLLADGFTREAAYRSLGKDKAPVCIREGTRSEALKYAFTANSHHGAPLTNADKRRAASLAVADPELGKGNDKWIAKTLGLSTSFVSSIRRGEKPGDRQRRAAAKKGEPEPKPKATPRKKNLQEPAPEARATTARILKEIEDYVNRDMIDEEQVIKIFESPSGRYRWMAKEGMVTKLRIVGPSGKVIGEVPVIVRGVNQELIELKYEGDQEISFPK